MHGPAGITLVTISGVGVTDVEVAVAQDDVLPPNIRVRVDVYGAVLHPRRYHDVVGHITRYLAF